MPALSYTTADASSFAAELEYPSIGRFPAANVKLLTDDQVYAQLESIEGKVSTAIDKINAGQGTIGQLMVNPQLYDSMTGVTREVQGLVKDMHANPKKFLTIRLTLF